MPGWQHILYNANQLVSQSVSVQYQAGNVTNILEIDKYYREFKILSAGGLTSTISTGKDTVI